MKNVALYYRVSTDKQDLVSQREAVEAWLSALPSEKKPDSIRIFQDEGRSGADNGRPGFQSMLLAAEKGEIDTVVCFKLDRFSRSATTAIRTILDLDTKGVGFISTSQPVLNLSSDNPFRRTMLAVFSEIAELERETIVSRINAGLDAARRRGVRLGRKPISEQKKKRMRELYEAGFNKSTIGRQLNVHYRSVWKVLKQYETSPRPDA